ncbi:MAG: tripartite tricarboxylate transporter substrate binding protein [Candidatus Accumulibacter sp.]|jgi:tripartite-type tricarboxylate transporter receptor subunit TctC|nr:tripartite tricarboxylate transporter substrate binding protein [Accumulibacter sp.]
MKKLNMLSVAVSALVLTAGGQALAQGSFPEREVTIVVPFNPGGASDMTSRIIAKGLEPELGKPVVVVNKAGGSGGVGMSQVARGTPDGYTLSYIPVELVMHKALKLSDLEPGSFEFIGQVTMVPAAVTVPVDAPYDTIADFIKYAKANPGKVRVGNSGAGSIWHIAASALEGNQGVTFNHIPFEGAAPAVTALMGKHIEAVAVNAGEVKSGVDAGKLKILAIMTPERDPAFPKVPTLIESGIKLEFAGWGGFAAPKGTPKPVVDKLAAALEKAASSQEFKDFITSRGMIVRYRNAGDFGKFVDEQYVFFNDLLSKMELGK